MDAESKERGRDYLAADIFLSFGLRPMRTPFARAICRPFVGALDDSLALVLSHGRHHRHETAPHGSFKVYIAPIENLDRGSGVDHGLDDLQAVPHRARRSVPFGSHKLVASVEVCEQNSEPKHSPVSGRGLQKTSDGG
jgi:hypothetical protein